MKFIMDFFKKREARAKKEALQDLLSTLNDPSNYKKTKEVCSETPAISKLEGQVQLYLSKKKNGEFDQIIAELSPFLSGFSQESELRRILSSTYLDRGAAKYQLGNDKQAMSDWEAAVRADPKNYKALVNLSSLYEASQRWAEAAKALDRAFQINPELKNNQRIVERSKQIRGHL